MPADPVSAYKLARTTFTAYKLAERGYREARKQIAAYAEREGISEAEAWRRVQTEALRRGDAVLTRVSAAAIKHKRTLTTAAAFVSPALAPIVIGQRLLERRHAKREHAKLNPAGSNSRARLRKR